MRCEYTHYNFTCTRGSYFPIGCVSEEFSFGIFDGVGYCTINYMVNFELRHNDLSSYSRFVEPIAPISEKKIILESYDLEHPRTDP